MKWRDSFDSPFPFYLNDERKNILFISFISLFVVFFLHVYRPHHPLHTELTIPQKFLFGGVTFSILFLNIIGLPRMLPKTFDPSAWTIKKYILLTLFHCFLIGIASTIIDELYICPQRSLWQNFIGANKQVGQTGLIVITIMTLFLKNKDLQQTLRRAVLANEELDRIRKLKGEIDGSVGSSSLLTIQSETSDSLSLPLPHLLFVEADDNYSTVVWKNEEGIQRKLLRVNLKKVESQINNDFAVRCHRSFIVNVNAIGNVAGNAGGYRLQIRDTDISIPVSRGKGKMIMEKIQQIRNMMELA